MMSRVKRVLKRAVTGYIPNGPVNSIPRPPLNQIKIEAKSEVTEPLKQEITQELSKMPEEEHDEQELEDDDNRKPECFRDFDDTGGYDADDDECKNCDFADDCQSGSPEKTQPDETKPDQSKVDDSEKRTKVVEPASESEKPDKYTITKMLKMKAVREDGSFFMKTVPRGVGEVYVGEPPGKDDIEAILVPQYGGGEYSVINQSSKKVVKRYKFDGAARDPDEPVPEIPQVAPMAALFQGVQPQQAQPGQQPAQSAQQPGQATLDRIQWAMAQGSIKATEQLAALAEKFSETGDIEKLNLVLGSLKEIATGHRDTNSSDRLTDMLEKDRTMMMTMLLEGKKGKESSSSDIVRETMSTMKEMFSLAKEFAPGEDTGVQMVREVSGVVKDGLKEVTDTVIQVTGSKPLKQVEPQRYVYRCERCKAEVQPHFKACPSCGLVFKPGVITTPPPAPSIPVETFEKPAPPLPPEVRDKMGYLRKLAAFIQYDHDAAVKGSAFFKQADPESKLMLLFTANFGYNNIMKLVAPWRTSKEIPEGEVIFRTVESPNGRLWINTFFAAIKKAAEEEKVTLDQGTIEKYLDEINLYSPIKFHFKAKQKVPTPVPALAAPTIKKVKGEEVAMSICPICDQQVPTLQYKDHLFQQHPKSGQPVNSEKVNQRVKAAIAQGASVLPRGVTVAPVEEASQEQLAPNDRADGTEE